MRSAGRGRRGFGTIALCCVNLPLRMFLPIHGASPSSIRRRCLLCPQQFFFLRKCNALIIKGLCAWFGGTKVYVQEYRYSYVMTIYTLDHTLYILLTTHFIYSCIDTIYSLHHILYTVSFTVCAQSYVCTAYLLLRRRHSRREKERRTPGGRVAPPVCASWFAGCRAYSTVMLMVVTRFASIFRSFS